MALTEGQIKEVKQIEKMLSIMCTKEEIKGVLGRTDKYINMLCVEYYGKEYEEIVSLYQGLAKSNLRRIQFDHAEKNPVMAIWLGKQYLGQSDRVETKTEEKITFVNDLPEDEEE